MINVKIPKLKIAGIDITPNSSFDSLSGAPRRFKQSPTVSLPRIASNFDIPTKETPKPTQNIPGLIFGTGKAIFQAAATKKGRETFEIGAGTGSYGTEAAIEQTLASVIHRIDQGITGFANVAGRLREKATGGIIKAPKITSPLLPIAQKLEQKAIDNYQVFKDLSAAGVDVTDERKFSEKIQDPQFIARGVGQNIPNLIASLGLAVPVALAGAPAAAVGGTAFLASATMEGGFAYNEARDFLLSSDNAAYRKLGEDRNFLESIAIPVGIVNGLLDAVPVTKVLNRSGIATQIKRDILREATKRVVGQALAEGGTESIQEIVSNSAKKVYDENQGLLEGVGEAGFFGALMGGGTSAIADIPAATRGITPRAGLSIEDVSKRDAEANAAKTQKNIEALAEEAKKFSSAEEFANSVVYHGTNEDAARRIEKYGFRVPEGTPGVSFAADFETALSYTNQEENDFFDAESTAENAKNLDYSTGKYRDQDVVAVIPKKGAKNIGTDGMDKLTGEDIYRPEDFVVIGWGQQNKEDLIALYNQVTGKTPVQKEDQSAKIKPGKYVVVTGQRGTRFGQVVGSISNAAYEVQYDNEQRPVVVPKARARLASRREIKQNLAPKKPSPAKPAEKPAAQNIPTETLPNEELVDFKVNNVDPTIPENIDEFNKLPLKKQEEVFELLPRYLQQEIMGFNFDEEFKGYMGGGGVVQEVASGKAKILITQDVITDFRLRFNKADYMRIFRKPNPQVSYESIDELASDGGFESDEAFIDALVQALDERREVNKRALEERERIRRVKLGEIGKFQEEAERYIAMKELDIQTARALALRLPDILQTVQKELRRAERIEKKNVALEGMLKRLNSRRQQLTAIKHFFNLTDKQMKEIRNNKDPRYMTDAEWTEYLSQVKDKAELEAAKDKEKMLVAATIEQNNLKKPENLQRAMDLPPLKDMTLEQLQQFNEALSPYENDTFLGPRTIQTVTNTDIGPVKTIGEIREALAKQTGVSLDELKDVHGEWGDKFNYDAALALKNPLYKFMVTEWTAKKIETDQKLLELQKNLNYYAKRARASRQRTLIEKLVPQDTLVTEWLQGTAKERETIGRTVTIEEREYAHFLDKTYTHYYDVAATEAVQRKTLLGVKFSRFKGVYFPHTPISFFERYKEVGFAKAFEGWWNYVTEQKVDFDALGPTGEVLGYEKFLKYALKREGTQEYSRNAARVTMAYVAAFERKLALDAIIPKVDAFTFSLERPAEKQIVDPTGGAVDGKLRTFVREWLNNKKGRKKEFVLAQGGKFDAGMRAFKLFLSLKDLGFNIIAGTASIAGGQVANYVGMPINEYATGIARALTPKGTKLALRYNGVVGEPTFENVISAANDIGDTFTAGAFYLFQDFFYRAKRQFFLGSLTQEEYDSGIVTPRRLAEIKLKMAKTHPIEDMRSVVGSTSEAQVFSMYKTWAVPFLFTARRGLGKIISSVKEGDKMGLVSEEVRQLFKIVVGGIGIYLFFHGLFGDDPKDKSFTARLKRRIILESTSALSAINPSTWLQIRPLQFAMDIADAVDQLIKLEEYKTSGPGYQKGELKGVKSLERQFLPSAFRQFIEPAKEGRSSGSPTKINTGATVRIPKIKVPSIKVSI